MQNLSRRGFDLGPIPHQRQPNEHQPSLDALACWHDGKPVYLPGACAAAISTHAGDIGNTEQLVLAILEGENAEDLLSVEPYQSRLYSKFESLGSAYNEGDTQEVQMIMFDAIDGSDITAEDLWMKISWLSFYDEDASIRFRFSFGVDLEEDVAADPLRQHAAATLAEAVFPESSLVTHNAVLKQHILQITGNANPQFVERILYFNAPNGGAYLHHDMERGHAGVVYAQLTGSTFWLALPQNILVNEILSFLQEGSLPGSLTETQQSELTSLANEPKRLTQELNSFAHEGLIHLINETSEFVQYLIEHHHYRILNAGDVILLPQTSQEHCCWHSVFCLGEEMGQALSFAIR